MGFLPYCSCVNTTIWMHNRNADKTHREKPRWEQNKKAVCCLEQIEHVTPHKTAAVRSPASHLTNYPSKTNKICRTLLVMYRLTNEWRFLMNSYLETYQGWPPRKYIYNQICADRGCSLENQRGVLDGEKESGTSVLTARVDEYDNDEVSTCLKWL